VSKCFSFLGFRLFCFWVYCFIWLLNECSCSTIQLQQTEPTSPDPCPPEPAKPTIHSFCKILTASDTSTHGGFSVLRKHATECLPPLVITLKWCLDVVVGCSLKLPFLITTISYSLGHEPSNTNSGTGCQRSSWL